MSTVAVVDSGVANLASMAGALGSLGARVEVTVDPQVVVRADRIVLPGVGHFATGLGELRRRELDRALLAAAAADRPLLAVCLGLQMLSAGSEESPGTEGLGLVAGWCRALPPTVRIPHLGWNGVEPDPGCRLLAPGNAAFANSYALVAPPPGWQAAWSRHGTRFVAALERGRTLACQFHPELSGAWGRDLLARWLRDEPALDPDDAASPVDGLAHRIIPCLDVKHGRVVKGIRFQELRDSGDPAARAALYQEQGADEIVLLDIAASPEAADTHVETVRRVRGSLAIPLTVGGGVRAVGDGRRLLAAGADKIAVNSAAVARPSLLAELAQAFGRQCVVLAIDARRRDDGWEVLVNGGRRPVDLDALDWASRGVESGAGEILLTSWDRDGTRGGCDLDLLAAVSSRVPVPVIASGGIGDDQHVADALAAGADAVLAASIFHDDDRTVAGVKETLAGKGYRVRR